jgi:hypothetical protein
MFPMAKKNNVPVVACDPAEAARYISSVLSDVVDRLKLTDEELRLVASNPRLREDFGATIAKAARRRTPIVYRVGEGCIDR